MNEFLNPSWPKLLLATCVLAACQTGCAPKEEVAERRPRPVSVQTLRKQPPPNSQLVAASVGSWKTEQIGFEVSGRVESVVEPNTEILGRVIDKQGNQIFAGEPIGQLDSERYVLQKEKAEAELERSQLQIVASREELKSIEAQITAAEASEQLAKIEFERSQSLFRQNAGAESDVDRDRANLKTAEAEKLRLMAVLESKRAEIKSLESSLQLKQKDVDDATRNLRDCTLYSSFDGQIAEVSVVPGSVVSAGAPVATVQLMNPIKIDFEVSAEQSRTLQRAQRPAVYIAGYDEPIPGYLYQVDPVADPLTRTFTVTLLFKNEQITRNGRNANVPAVKDIWPLDFDFLPEIKQGRLMVEENAIRSDADGHYLWLLPGLDPDAADNGSRIQETKRVPITLGDFKLLYLGNWLFQEIQIDEEGFDIAGKVVAGGLSFMSDEQAANWDRTTVYIGTGRSWMLRPGDLVKVDLSGPNAAPGYYVSMDAIAREGDKSYLFAIDQDSEGNTVASKILVDIVEATADTTTSSLRKVNAAYRETRNAEGQAERVSVDLEGLEYITQGAHYLIDGEPVAREAGEPGVASSQMTSDNQTDGGQQ